jgi:hypothetical protein
VEGDGAFLLLSAAIIVFLQHLLRDALYCASVLLALAVFFPQLRAHSVLGHSLYALALPVDLRTNNPLYSLIGRDIERHLFVGFYNVLSTRQPELYLTGACTPIQFRDLLLANSRVF